jgi:hypothetical protein
MLATHVPVSPILVNTRRNNSQVPTTRRTNSPGWALLVLAENWRDQSSVLHFHNLLSLQAMIIRGQSRNLMALPLTTAKSHASLPATHRALPSHEKVAYHTTSVKSTNDNVCRCLTHPRNMLMPDPAHLILRLSAIMNLLHVHDQERT